MNLNSRSVGSDLKAVQVAYSDTAIDLGLLDMTERLALAQELLNSVYGLIRGDFLTQDDYLEFVRNYLE